MSLLPKLLHNNTEVTVQKSEMALLQANVVGAEATVVVVAVAMEVVENRTNMDALEADENFLNSIELLGPIEE